MATVRRWRGRGGQKRGTNKQGSIPPSCAALTVHQLLGQPVSSPRPPHTQVMAGRDWHFPRLVEISEAQLGQVGHIDSV